VYPSCLTLLGYVAKRACSRVTARTTLAQAALTSKIAGESPSGADAMHLATAVAVGADRFITNNQRDFRPTITEVAVTYPADLSAATP